jgi:hypothetical protein
MQAHTVTTFEFLCSRLESDFDDGMFKHDPGFEEQFSDYLASMSNAYTSDSWGIHSKGLCQILAWANELLQQGTDWKPPQGMFDPS